MNGYDRLSHKELVEAYRRLAHENSLLRQELNKTRSENQSDHKADLSSQDKIRVFRSLFRDREDVYAVRWSNTRTGKSGLYSALADTRQKASLFPQ